MSNAARRVRALAVGMVVVTVAACSGGGSGASSATKHSTTSTTNIDFGCRYIVASTGGRSTIPGTDLDYLVNAVATPTACYDQISFTFDRGNGSDLPPSYTVEYRKAPFGLEGISTTTSGFEPAKFVLYVEFRPTSTVDLRAGRNVQMYKGNLRLQLVGMRHANIVEWIRDLVPAPADRPGTYQAECAKGATGASTGASTGAPTTTTPKPTTTTKPKSSKSSSASSTTTTVPPTTSTTSFGTTIDVAQQRVVWLIGLDACRPFTVDAANQPPRVNILIMN
jgi:hypothetical protein